MQITSNVSFIIAFAYHMQNVGVTIAYAKHMQIFLSICISTACYSGYLYVFVHTCAAPTCVCLWGLGVCVCVCVCVCGGGGGGGGGGGFVNPLPAWQNDGTFADDIAKCIFFHGCFGILV